MWQLWSLHDEIYYIANTVVNMHALYPVLENFTGDIFWEDSGNSVIDFRETTVVFYVERWGTVFIYFHWGIILETVISKSFLPFLPLPQKNNYPASSFYFLSHLYWFKTNTSPLKPSYFMGFTSMQNLFLFHDCYILKCSCSKEIWTSKVALVILMYICVYFWCTASGLEKLIWYCLLNLVNVQASNW